MKIKAFSAMREGEGALANEKSMKSSKTKT